MATCSYLDRNSGLASGCVARWVRLNAFDQSNFGGTGWELVGDDAFWDVDR